MTIDPIVLGPGEGTTIAGPAGEPLTFKARGAQTGGALTPVENVIAPGDGPPLHVHANEDEAWYVIGGELRFRLDAETADAPAGSFVFVPRGVPHSFKNVGREPARILVLFTPAGMERFFDRFAALPAGSPDPGAFARLGGDVGMRVVGPPMAGAAHDPREDDALLQRLARVDASSLTDADKTLRVLPPALRPVAPGTRMAGRAVTAAAHGDLMSVIAALHRGGPGEVLVVADDGAELAVSGELFASEAIRRGMAGIVIDGFCRDTATLAQLPLPFYARGSTPRAAPAQAIPEIGVPVLIGGVEVRPGDLLLGDDDGIVVATESEAEAAIDAAEAIQRYEAALRSSMQEETSLFDKLNFVEHNERLQAGRDSTLAFE